MTVMAANRLDAILYPHQKRLVVPIGEEQVERNGVLSNSTGFPALTFPGGFSPPTATAPIGVPVGLELLGPEWSEPALFKLAYAFEQASRRPREGRRHYAPALNVRSKPDQRESKRSRFITLFQAATKSSTNFSFASALP